MTLISDKLHSVGYATHFIGKWHVGMASRSLNPPEARGFDTSFGYFHSTNSYYNNLRAEGCADHPATDLWDTGAPSVLNGSAYEELMFAQRAVELIHAHDARRPFFLYYAFHVKRAVCPCFTDSEPADRVPVPCCGQTSCVGWNASGTAGGESDSLQPDAAYYARAAFIDDPDRRAK